MTRDEIMKLEAGREMDTLVAKKVMGGGRVGRPNYPLDNYWSFDTISAVTLPPFSTNISAAWKVVDKLCSIGKAVGLHKSNVRIEEPWSFYISWSERRGNHTYVMGETAIGNAYRILRRLPTGLSNALHDGNGP